MIAALGRKLDRVAVICMPPLQPRSASDRNQGTRWRRRQQSRLLHWIKSEGVGSPALARQRHWRSFDRCREASAVPLL